MVWVASVTLPHLGFSWSPSTGALQRTPLTFPAFSTSEGVTRKAPAQRRGKNRAWMEVPRRDPHIYNIQDTRLPTLKVMAGDDGRSKTPDCIPKSWAMLSTKPRTKTRGRPFLSLFQHPIHPPSPCSFFGRDIFCFLPHLYLWNAVPFIIWGFLGC